MTPIYLTQTLRHLRTPRLLLASACVGAVAMAQPAGGQGGSRTPPAEALAACSKLTSGAACSFTGTQGTATGTCFAPEGKPLACRPSGAPPQGGSSSTTPAR